MKRICVALFSVSLVTLVTELLLTRIFDYVIGANMAYMVITCAMFSFGLSGIYSTLIRPPSDHNWRGVASLFFLLAASILLLLPAINFLPFDASQIGARPRFQMLAFGLLYITICIPFFLSGLFINTVFAVYPQSIQSLYFWDLIGAAYGCVIFIPFLPHVGPGGLLLCAAGMALLTSALFCKRWLASTIVGVIGAIIIIIPFYHSSVYLDIRQSNRESGIKARDAFGTLEFSRWDPVARIEVVDSKSDAIKKLNPPFDSFKGIEYDGGRQHGTIYPFDGNFAKLRENLREVFKAQFFNIDNLVSNYLKRDSGQKVLIIGVAGGQEIKAALMYGASYVDGVDIVGTVIELGKKTYAAFNGNIFNHPKVHVHVAEGRSFLRSTRTKYDIIQIISNHTTSSIAAGQGAMNPVYLQTSEAYREYFEHLTANGILHVSFLVYPRMVTTAAKAWKEMGRADFQKHVVVIARAGERTIQKTFLVKMKPWTEEEFNDLKRFLFEIFAADTKNYMIVENPLYPDQSFLSKEFYSGNISAELASRMDYRVTPATDDRPYFTFIRKHLGTATVDASKFMDFDVTWVLNQHVFPFFPRDIFHLVITAAMSLIFCVLFVLVPLYFSRVGKQKWPYKKTALFYFACLGFGFIIIELTLIQRFIHFIGYPLYTYSTVLFMLLLSAGMGSYYSKRLQINPGSRWTWPFIGIIVCGLVLLAIYSSVVAAFLSMPIPVRIFVSALMIFPLGFFLGMPFPLGIRWLEKQPQGAITWAWALNAMFTVVGGFSSVIISIFLGFRMTMVIAFIAYLVAFWMFSRLQGAEAARQF
jgi:predicted membrane-bound spermidine synthase